MGELDNDELKNVINKINVRKSIGPDELDPRVIKNCQEQISKPLSIIINNIFETGDIPDELKIGKIIPIYKNKEKDLPKNYRPITVLSVFTKIFEKILYNRLSNFMEKNKIINKKQYGFRNNYNTEKALCDSINKIKWQLDKGNIVMVTYFDLTKAFDVINRDILTQKLQYYGIRGTSLKLMKNYLNNRQQYVQIGQTKSDILINEWGVPQGSNMGPMLYNLFVNDIFTAEENIELILYADDTSVITTGTNIQEVAEKMQNAINVIKEWFENNELQVNKEKTKIIVFRNKNKIINTDGVEMKYGETKIEIVESTTFLGITVNKNLNWNLHVNRICNKLTKNVGIINRIKNLISKKLLINLYYTLIYSNLQYCVTIWGLLSKTNQEKINRIQNKILDILANRKLTNMERIQKARTLKMLTFRNIYNMSMALTMYKKIYLNEYEGIFEINKRTCNRNIRNIKSYIQPKIRTEIGRQTIEYMGVKIWEEIPNEIKEAKNIRIFKRKYKEWLISKQI